MTKEEKIEKIEKIKNNKKNYLASLALAAASVLPSTKMNAENPNQDAPITNTEMQYRQTGLTEAEAWIIDRGLEIDEWLDVRLNRNIRPGGRYWEHVAYDPYNPDKIYFVSNRPSIEWISSDRATTMAFLYSGNNSYFDKRYTGHNNPRNEGYVPPRISRRGEPAYYPPQNSVARTVGEVGAVAHEVGSTIREVGRTINAISNLFGGGKNRGGGRR